MQIHIANIIPIIIAFQSLFFAFVLLTDRSKKKVSNYILSSFLLVLCIQFISILLIDFYHPPFLESTVCIYGFIYGPLLYLYTRSLIHKSFLFRFNHLLHFSLPLVLVIVSGFGISTCTYAGVFIYVSLLTYTFISIKEIFHYRLVIKETQSSIGKANLIWLQWTMIIFCLALSLDIVDQLIISTDVFEGISSIFLTILILINWIFYKGLRQPEIFLGISKSDREVLLKKKKIPVKKDPDKIEQKEIQLIKNFMSENDIYTNSDLTLHDFSEVIDIPSRQLSYLINAFFHKSFMTFINDYRIEKAKERLKNTKDSKETILEVMYDVGFNSKSSFNTYFKSKTGLTPSEFKKKYSK